MLKPAKILFFIEGPMPSEEEQEEAADLKANVVYRNALAVPTEAHSLEECDGVAGKVPKIYADAKPKAEDAISAKSKKAKDFAAKMGDVKAPKPAEKPAEKPAPKPDPKTAWNPNK